MAQYRRYQADIAAGRPNALSIDQIEAREDAAEHAMDISSRNYDTDAYGPQLSDEFDFEVEF